MSVSYTAIILSGFPITAEEAKKIEKTNPALFDTYVVNFDCYNPDGNYYFGIIKSTIEIEDGPLKLSILAGLLGYITHKDKETHKPFFDFKKEYFPEKEISIYWGIAVC